MHRTIRPLRLSVLIFLVSALLAFPATATAVAPEEQTRIDALLDAVGRQSDLVFIRNGSEHTAEEAVSHLKRKLRSAGSRISTAEEFIDHLATSSSFSDKPYMVRQPGHPAEPAGPFFHRLLREVAPLPARP